MRGKTGRLGLDQEYTNHVVLVDGKIARVRGFLTGPEALTAAGQAE